MIWPTFYSTKAKIYNPAKSDIRRLLKLQFFKYNYFNMVLYTLSSLEFIEVRNDLHTNTYGFDKFFSKFKRRLQPTQKRSVYSQFIHKGKVDGEGTPKAFFKSIFWKIRNLNGFSSISFFSNGSSRWLRKQLRFVSIIPLLPNRKFWCEKTGVTFSFSLAL